MLRGDILAKIASSAPPMNRGAFISRTMRRRRKRIKADQGEALSHAGTIGRYIEKRGLLGLQGFGHRNVQKVPILRGSNPGAERS